MNQETIRICAGIVTFNPEINLLKNNIESILPQVQELVLFDNGSRNITEVQKLAASYDNCSCIHDEENRGIAYALNRLCEWGEDNKYTWIITLDQDSISPQGLVENLSKYAGTDVAVIAPNIVYKNNEEYAVHTEKRHEEVPWVITSASLTNLSVWKTLDGFDEWLFIDGVDYDYGIRANKNGYKVIRSYETELLHELGNLKCVNVLGKVLYVTNHSAFRKYYMTRNTIYLRDKLKQGQPVRTIAKYVIKVIMFEDNKMEKMASIVHGVSDGLKKIRGGVLVIVSTYNGERYLREQLDSLINQTGIEVHILVRDDGSNDGTVEVLKEYDERYENLSYYAGENKGVIASFNDLMLRPELDQYEYVAFCDQDDVWDHNKLHIAASYIGEDNTIPVMYCSNLMLVDSNLNPIKPMRKNVKKYTAHMSVVQNIGTGCTQVFNRKAVELYRQGIGSRMEMHDYWMTLLCLFLGKVIYDNNPHIQYRQHGNNVVGAKDKHIRIALKNLNEAGAGVRIPMLSDFIDHYRIAESDLRIIYRLIEHEAEILSQVLILVSPLYKGISREVSIGFKLRVLTRKLY